MRLNRKAWQYAKALFNAADSVKAVSEVGAGMELVLQLMKTEAVFRAFFQTRKLTPANKGEVLRKVLGDKIHELNIEFLLLLAERKEWLMFGQVAKGYRELQVRAGNIVNVLATTAEPLNESDLQLVKDTITKATGKDLKVSTSIDKEMLGGIKLRIGNLFIDGSLKSSLVRMRRQLIES